MHAGLCLLCALVAQDPMERVGTLEHPAIEEASGIVQSRRHPGIFWVHNDSGNPPAIFAVKLDGSLVREYRVAAPNIDWEDIAIDDAGHLFLGDIGNNFGKLPVRAIYRIDEPDPKRPAAGPLPVTLASYYRFPRGEGFDAESLFIDHNRAIVIAKNHDEHEADIYEIPLDPPAPLGRPALPKKLGSLPGFREPATGADLSTDGRWLAVCATSEARVYERVGDSWQPAGKVKYDDDEQIEAVAWDGRDLILAGEERGIFRVKERAWWKRR